MILPNHLTLPSLIPQTPPCWSLPLGTGGETPRSCPSLPPRTGRTSHSGSSRSLCPRREDRHYVLLIWININQYKIPTYAGTAGVAGDKYQVIGLEKQTSDVLLQSIWLCCYGKGHLELKFDFISKVLSGSIFSSIKLVIQNKSLKLHIFPSGILLNNLHICKFQN